MVLFFMCVAVVYVVLVALVAPVVAQRLRRD